MKLTTASVAEDDRGSEIERICAPNTRVRLLCGLGIGLGCLWRLIEVWQHNPAAEIWSDSGRNWEFGSLGTRTHPLVFMDPIGYQTFLAAVEKLTLGLPLLVFAVVVTLSLLTPWIWYRFFRELLDSKTIALAGWAVLALLPSWIGIYSYFMMETLFLPLFGLALWTTWRCHRKKDTASFVLMGFCWLLAALTRSIAGPMAAVVVLAMWFRQPAKVPKAAYVGSAVLIVLLMLGYRSYARTGIFAPLGNPYLNQCYVWSGCQEIVIDYAGADGENYHYAFGSPISTEAPFSPLFNWTNARTGSFHVQIELGNQMRDWRNAVARAKAEGWSWTQVVKENMVYLFFGRSWPDCAPDRSTEMATQMMRWLWAPLAVLGLAGLAYRRAALGFSATLLLLVIGTWLVIQGLTPLAVNEGRYRKPMEGVFIAAVLLVARAQVRPRLVS